ncbi:hypothetical protein O197_09 [Edwardsiella phage eiAU-183]|uniref:Uncharacterized protein n=5 Tax=Viruses TaxID=10239 RepID=W0LMW6_9CAUD|nr:hypothetical protein CH09_gp09 [Edwardsiella phage eiAU-183]YP_009613859.1 hypothetical protein FDI58_gp09 [Edwardsiella phage eiAU]AHG23425.1 hypothetical protein P858_09 [Edwardsiella phage eiAU]AHG23479.1 hypothetical protein O197_09 [Edwardsiella phage eiAU-183]
MRVLMYRRMRRHHGAPVSEHHHYYHPLSGGTEVMEDVTGYRHPKHHDSHSAVMESVRERVHEHPATWASHISQPGGMMAVVEMEYHELMTKKEQGSREGIEHELVDLAAACIAALEKMHKM